MRNELASADILTRTDVQAYIDSHCIGATLVDEIGDTPTVPAAAKALGVHTDQIVKTLLFLIRLDDPDAPVPLVVISKGMNRVEKKPIAQIYGVGKKRVRLAPPEVVIEILGYPVGGVAPFPHKKAVPVVLDESILDLRERFDGIIFAGGGDTVTLMRLTVDELLNATEATTMPLSVEE